MRCSSWRHAKLFLTSLALASLLLEATVAAPSSPSAVPQRSQADDIDGDLALFDVERKDAEAATTKFTVTFGQKLPEDMVGVAEAAKFQMSVAAATAAEARSFQEQAAAIEKTSPEVARNLRIDALNRIENARRSLREARAILSPPTQTLTRSGVVPQMPVAPTCNTPTCKLLKILSTTDAENNGTVGHGVDGSAILPVTPSWIGPARDRILKGSFRVPPKVSPDGSAVVDPRGGRTELGPLRDAVASIAPTDTARPLITQCGGFACPSRELLTLLADKAKRDELRRIGGVSLDMTLDKLAGSGMSELRGGMDIGLVENPVLISLKSLAAAAEPWVGDWDKAPDSIRFPGGVDRIHGFVLSSDGSDVLLVGTAASTADTRIDIDELSIVLAAIWRDGLAPAISLDPRPDQMGGPQYPRIIDLPPDSTVTAIMLDADYSMKAINLGAGWAEPLDLIGRRGIVEQNINKLPDFVIARFWLTPHPLAGSQIYRSLSGRTLLFETTVQAQTETMFLQNGQLLGSGSAGDVQQQIARAFTAAYPELERDVRVRPASIFTRLHGLMDISATARILRTLAVHSTALDRIAALPWRHLRGTAAIPPSYPGLSGRLELNAGVLSGQGGAQLAITQDADSVPPYVDRIGTSLEASADRWSSNIATTLPMVFGVPLSSASAISDDDDEQMLAANRDLERENWGAAQSAFQAYIARRPEQASGYHGLALALIGAGKLSEARLPAARALVLAPGDAAGFLLLEDLAWQFDPNSTAAQLTAAERRALSNYYAELAGIALARGKTESAGRNAGWAIKLDPDNGDAYLVRAFLAPPPSQQRELDIALAVRSYRRLLRAGDVSASKRLAIGLLIAAKYHLERGSLAAIAQRVSGVEEHIRSAYDESREAEAINPALVEASAMRMLTGAILDRFINPTGSVSLAIQTEANALEEQFPQDSIVPLVRSQLYGLDARWAEAVEQVTRAITLSPNNPILWAARAEYESAESKCAESAADFGKALQLAGSRARSLGIEAPTTCGDTK